MKTSIINTIIALVLIVVAFFLAAANPFAACVVALTGACFLYSAAAHSKKALTVDGAIRTATDKGIAHRNELDAVSTINLPLSAKIIMATK